MTRNPNPLMSLLEALRTLLAVGGSLILAASALADGKPWTGSGPAGVRVFSFAVDPSTPSRVFALGVGGLLRSADGGAHWTRVPSRVSGLYGLTIGPSSTIYAIDSVRNRVAHSEDDGATWQTDVLPLGADDRAYQVAADPLSDQILYVGTTTTVLKTTNGGGTWTRSSGIPSGASSLAIDPTNPSIVYAGNSGGGGVFRSTDGGLTWALAGTRTEAVLCLTLDPTRPSTVYACFHSGVAQSTDGGGSWTSVLLTEHPVQYFVVAPGTPSMACAATYDRLFLRSGDGGAWSSLQFGLEGREDVEADTLAVVPSDPATILVAGRNGILRSLDGVDWTIAQADGNASIEVVLADPSNSAAVYAGGQGGVFASENAGGSWTPPDLTSPRAYALTADSRTPSVLLAGGFGVSKSTDGGATWEAAGNGIPRTTPITALAISPHDPAEVLAGSMFGVLYKSEDGGVNFQQTGDLPFEDAGYPQRLDSIAFDRSNRSTVYVAGDGADYFGQGAAYKTIDGGAHWTDLGVGRSGALSVVVDPLTRAVYLATREGVIKSFDRGATWSPSTSMSGVLVMDPRDPETLYLGGSDGVSRSFDAGATWAPFGTELTGNVSSLALSSDGTRLYAGTWYDGAFAYDLADPLAPCEPRTDTLCLLGGRFRVTVVADDRRGRTSAGVAVPQGERFGYFSLPAFTGDASLPEVFIKMIEASWLRNGSFLIVYNGLTSLPYALAVTDTTTGVKRVFRNEGFCGGAATEVFAAAEPAEDGESSIRGPATALAAAGTELSLLAGRFQVTLSATNPRDGRTAEGFAISRGDRFGYFSLPDVTGVQDFPEVCVKMIDATSFDGHFWFFHSGLTSLSYTLTLTDGLTGDVRTYQNGSSPGTRFCGGADTKVPR